jgi:hypothetical protein
MKLGTFWARPGYNYGPNAVYMDRFACRSWVPQKEYHPYRCEARVDDFLNLHPTGEVMVRCDWSWVFPQIPVGRGDRANWRQRVAWAVNRQTYKDARTIWFQLWNEPQLEGAPDWHYCADHFAEFVDIVKSYVPQALILPTPIAPYHPNALGAPPAPPGVEDSPWARLYAAQEGQLALLSLPYAPDAHNVHVYGDPQVGDPFYSEPWTDHKKTPEGWRFAFNVARTWQKIHEEVSFEAPTVVSEFNTAARGVAPNINYPQGWLFNAVGALGASLDEVHSALWFVGHDNGGWADYVLHDIPSLEAEFWWLKQHGW